MSFVPLKPRGRDAVERILWMGLFAEGIDGRRGLPFVLVGDPGAGKTSRTKQLVRSAGLYFESIVASLRAPSDFLGVPIPAKLALTPYNQHLSPDGDSEITITEMAPPAFAIRAASHRRSCILLDEVNTAPPATQAALLRLLFEGAAGEFMMPPTVRMLLAMNRTEDAAGGWEISAPLANRMGWLDAEPPTPERFAEYLMNAGARAEAPIDPRVEEQEVDARWPEAYAVAAGKVGGFVCAKSDMLLRKPKAGSKQAAGPWPSPRSHEFAARGMAGCLVYGMSPAEIDQVVAAYVGGSCAGEFHDWVKHNDLPNPADLLDGLATFQHNPARLDRTAAVLTSCTSLVVREGCEKRKERADALWGIHQLLADDAVDIALGSVVAMCNARLMLGSRVAYKVLAKMEPVMTAAGITPQSAP